MKAKKKKLKETRTQQFKSLEKALGLRPLIYDEDLNKQKLKA